jgi:protein required for attachment to host cells
MMASDKDILGKADALLRRHMGAGSDTGAFPVLTDLIADPTRTASSEEIAGEILASVISEVESRFAVDLEKRLADQLAPHIHAAVVATLGDLRQELANAIGDAVTAALERRHVK